MTEDVVRLPSGIAGVDAVLGGGFLAGGVYIVLGAPGAGKTIFANQLAFHHARGGSRVLYVSLLAESHARLFAHLAGMSFFERDHVATSVHYVSGYQALEAGGLSGLLGLMRTEARERGATLLVVDGLVAAESFAGSRLELKKFVHELQSVVGLLGCTAFLLTSGSDPELSAAEHTMVDGIVELSSPMLGVRQIRELTVKKFRGSAHLQGRHAFEISDAGVRVYPRLEALVARELAQPAAIDGIASTGVPDLDELVGGGFARRTATLALGPSGAGKTMLALHFLAEGLRAGERCLYFGFNETGSRLLERARRSGLELDAYLKTGQLDVKWQPTVEHVADGLAVNLLERAEQHRAQRVVVDSIEGLKESILVPERTTRFLAALTSRLRALGATTLYLEETQQLFGPTLDVPVSGISAVVESILYLRQVEHAGVLRRVLTVLKTRETRHDASLREFELTDAGMRMLGPIRGIEDVLTGSAHEPKP